MQRVCWYLVLWWLSLTFFSTNAQETPPIRNFKPEIYLAGNQNWDIAQDTQGRLYFANNDGLLEYNGSSWRLYPTPAHDIVRSVAVLEDRIYIGSYREFGYFKRNATGDLHYTSLSKSLTLGEDEIIWHIRILENQLIFQSTSRLYWFDPSKNKIKLSAFKPGYVRIYTVDDQLLLLRKGGQLHRLEKGKEILLQAFPKFLQEDLLVNVASKNGHWILFFRQYGIYTLKNGELTKFNSDFDKLFPQKKIFSALLTSANEIMLGTISSGLVVLDQNGRLKRVVNQGMGLSNNTVLQLFEDKQANVWLALDYGIDCLNNQSFITEYNNAQGILGTVYATAQQGGLLYLGSNQGLFIQAEGPNQPLRLIPGTEGQVWSLWIHEGKLWCGHANGIFQVQHETARKVISVPGVWGFRSMGNDQILCGTYQGLGVFNQQTLDWRPLQGFQLSARFFEWDGQDHVWVNHEKKGVFLLKIDLQQAKVTLVRHLTELAAQRGSSLARFDGKVWFGSQKGVFELTSKGEAIRQHSLSKLIDSVQFVSGKLWFDSRHDRLWSFSRWGIAYAQKSAVNTSFLVSPFYIPDAYRRSVVSFENLQEVGPQEYILGRTNGYLRLRLDQVRPKPHQVQIHQVQIIEGQPRAIDLDKSAEIAYSERSLKWSFHVPIFEKYQDVEFSHRLLGYRDEWSTWGRDSEVIMENIPAGSYVFEVKSRVGNQITSEVASFPFRVRYPWYASGWAWLFYVVSLGSLSLVVHRSYRRYFQQKAKEGQLKKEREWETERLKNEQKITELKNRQLEVDIESKNRELALLTMGNIKQNDFLRRIRKEIKAQTPIPENAPIFRWIDATLTSEKDWEFFEEAFNAVDKGFIDRAKKICPDLNPNDLKFCTYVRLNLSPKEIATLLNISTKSVEIKRYRLRKKLGLDSEVNLTEFILSI